MELAAQPIHSLFRANTCVIDLYLVWTTVGLCLMIYKLEKLSDQRFQAKLSLSAPSGNSELKPLYAQTALPPFPTMPSEFKSKKLPLSPGIPRCLPRYGMNIFWNHSMQIIEITRTLMLLFILLHLDADASVRLEGFALLLPVECFF